MTVFLEVRHRIKPLTNTAFDVFVDFYADAVVPRLESHGIDLIGGWKVNGGEMGWDLSLHRYENMAHAERALASLGQDKPLWAAAERLQGEVQVEEVTKFAQQAPYGTDARLDAALAAKPDKPRQYMLAVLEAGGGAAPAAIEQISKLVDVAEEAGALQLVTAYASMIGRSGELTDLWIMPNGLTGFDYHAGDPLHHILGPLRDHAPEESLFYLNPLPYSKLQ